MSFGEEFKNMRANGGAPKLTESAVKTAEANAKQADTPPEASAEQPEVESGFSNPFAEGQQQTLEDISETPAGETPEIPAPKPESKKVAIKINGKTFESVEEAEAYASQLEIELEKRDAYEKGKQDAQPKQEIAPEPKKIKKIADKLFEDPDGAMEDLEAHVLELAEKLLDSREQKKTQAQQATDTAKQTWDNFYKENNDLSQWQDEVNLVTQREWHRLKDLPAKQGLEEIAKLSRQYVASVKERALPKTALPSKTAVTANGSQKSTTATPPPATEKKVSFAQQVRSTNKRTAAQSEV